MLDDREYVRIAQEKTAVTARLSKRLIARVDLTVAHRHLADDRVTRAAVVEECLERFVAAGGMLGTDTRLERDLAHRKPFRMHLDQETVEAINRGWSSRPEAERLVPWDVIVTAVLDQIDAVDIGPPPTSTRSQPESAFGALRLPKRVSIGHSRTERVGCGWLDACVEVQFTG